MVVVKIATAALNALKVEVGAEGVDGQYDEYMELDVVSVSRLDRRAHQQVIVPFLDNRRPT